MAEIKMAHRRYVESHLRESGLLFQFILSEFFPVSQEIDKLKTHCVHLKSTSQLSLTQKEYEQRLQQVVEGIVKLIGSHQEHIRGYPWNVEGGSLDRLKNTCALFTQNSEQATSDIHAMVTYINKAWLHSLHCLEWAHTIRQKKRRSQTAIIAKVSLSRSISKVIQSIHRFSRTLIRAILQFRHDENVVFFLIRNKDFFHEVYGVHFFQKTLKRMFPKGPKEIQEFLVKKYSDRGFHHLIPMISENISELQSC